MPALLFWIFFIFIGTMAWGAILAAPWVPTLKAQRGLLIDNLKLEAPSDSPMNGGGFAGTIYDLGCGSGSILFAFADRYPEAKCIGYDVALFPLLLGWLRKLRSPKKYKNVSLRFGNFFGKHFADADVVVGFLMQKAYQKFIATLNRELKSGTIVAIEAWPLTDRTPIQTIEGEKLVPWYVYRWDR